MTTYIATLLWLAQINRDTHSNTMDNIYPTVQVRLAAMDNSYVGWRHGEVHFSIEYLLGDHS
jgi:hypothetical protein